MTDDLPLTERAELFRRRYAVVRAEIARVIVGHAGVIDGVLTGLFVGGHVLLEGVPGLGKTLLVRTLADALGLSFSRIQFTPDLMPADILGTTIISESPDGRRAFVFQPGPLFAQLVLADEVNRATPKTQSALLEAMQERSITVGGTTHRLQEPFFVLATQNPIEQEGTYPLPEAQLDRFLFKLLVDYSGRDEMMTILDRTTRNEWPRAERVMDGLEVLRWRGLVREVLIAPPVQDYAVRLVLATHPKGEFAPAATTRNVRCGASPRAAQALVLAGKVAALLDGRLNVAFDDVRRAYLPALRHRVLLNFEAQAEDVSPDGLLGEVLAGVPERPAS
jgi:MoxR-like ATPase